MWRPPIPSHRAPEVAVGRGLLWRPRYTIRPEEEEEEEDAAAGARLALPALEALLGERPTPAPRAPPAARRACSWADGFGLDRAAGRGLTEEPEPAPAPAPTPTPAPTPAPTRRRAEAGRWPGRTLLGRLEDLEAGEDRKEVDDDGELALVRAEAGALRGLSGKAALALAAAAYTESRKDSWRSSCAGTGAADGTWWRPTLTGDAIVVGRRTSASTAPALSSASPTSVWPYLIAKCSAELPSRWGGAGSRDKACQEKPGGGGGVVSVCVSQLAYIDSIDINAKLN